MFVSFSQSSVPACLGVDTNHGATMQNTEIGTAPVPYLQTDKGAFHGN